jgi:hypothetical protein
MTQTMTDQLSIEWDLGSGDDGYLVGQDFTLEPCADGVVVECLDREGREMGEGVRRLVLV